MYSSPKVTALDVGHYKSGMAQTGVSLDHAVKPSVSSFHHSYEVAM